MVKKIPLILRLPINKMRQDLEQVFEEVEGSPAKFQEALEAIGMLSYEIDDIINFLKEHKIFNTLHLALMKLEYERKKLLRKMRLEGAARVVPDDAAVGAPIVAPIKESKELESKCTEAPILEKVKEPLNPLTPGLVYTHVPLQTGYH